MHTVQILVSQLVTHLLEGCKAADGARETRMIFGNVRQTALWGFKLKKPCTLEWQRKFPEFKQIWISFLCGWGTLTWEDIGWVELEVCTTGASLTEKCRNIPALVNQLPSDICRSAWHWALGTEHLDPPGSMNSNSSSAEALTQTDSTWWTSLRTKSEKSEKWLANACNILTFCIAKVFICSYSQATHCLSSLAGHLI